MLAAEKSSKESATVVLALDQVHAALRAEAAGDNDRRADLLHSAWLAAPHLPQANWHLARVQVENEWLPAGQLASQAASAANLAAYRELRGKLDSPRAVRELARWCNKNGLADRARLHYAQLLAHASADAGAKKEAARELDLEQVAGAWFPRKELAARSAEAKQIEAAVEKWRPRLLQLQARIDGHNFADRDQAIAEFHRLDDPALIPVLPLLLVTSGDRFQEEAVNWLARHPQFEATVGLTRFAVLSRFGVVREAAIKALQLRPLHEFVPLLLEGPAELVIANRTEETATDAERDLRAFLVLQLLQDKHIGDVFRGVVTGVTATVLTDTNAAWPAIPASRCLVDVDSNATFPISSNTATTITVTGDLTTVFSVGRRYFVVVCASSSNPTMSRAARASGSCSMSRFQVSRYSERGNSASRIRQRTRAPGLRLSAGRTCRKSMTGVPRSARGARSTHTPPSIASIRSAYTRTLSRWPIRRDGTE